MSILIFFDINGTIIERDHRTDLPFSKAVDLTLNTTNAMKDVDTAARSDEDVFYEVLKNHQLTFTDDIWQSLLGHYKMCLDDYRHEDIWRPNVDILTFLNHLSQKKDIKLALITGELSLGALYKLEKIGVWHHFPTGGFGEDGRRRFDIATVALKKAHALYQESFDAIWVIGDTTLDIQTARHIGARVIAITTGAHSRQELAAEKPDYLIDRYSDLKNLF